MNIFFELVESTLTSPKSLRPSTLSFCPSPRGWLTLLVDSLGNPLFNQLAHAHIHHQEGARGILVPVVGKKYGSTHGVFKTTAKIVSFMQSYGRIKANCVKNT